MARVVELQAIRLRWCSRMSDDLRSALSLTEPSRFPTANFEEFEISSAMRGG